MATTPFGSVNSDVSPALLPLAAQQAVNVAVAANGEAIQHNGAAIATRLALDFEDAGLLTFTVADDAANTRVKVTPSTSLIAPTASPGLTGTPTAPTAAVDTSTTQLATTAFVVGQASAVNPLMDGTVAIGTSTRFARADHRHATDTSLAPLASPIFTGNLGIAQTPASSTRLQIAGRSTGVADLALSHTSGNSAFEIHTLASGHAQAFLYDSVGNEYIRLDTTNNGLLLGTDTSLTRIAAGVPGGGSSGDSMAFHRHPYGNLRHIEDGTVSVTTSGVNGSGSASVSWTDAFASAPRVVATTNGVTPQSTAHTDSITTTGATIFAANVNGTGPSTFTVHYVAIGQD